MSRNRHNNNNQVGLTCCYVKEKVNAIVGDKGQGTRGGGPSPFELNVGRSQAAHLKLNRREEKRKKEKGWEMYLSRTIGRHLLLGL